MGKTLLVVIEVMNSVNVEVSEIFSVAVDTAVDIVVTSVEVTSVAVFVFVTELVAVAAVGWILVSLSPLTVTVLVGGP